MYGLHVVKEDKSFLLQYLKKTTQYYRSLKNRENNFDRHFRSENLKAQLVLHCGIVQSVINVLIFCYKHQIFLIVHLQHLKHTMYTNNCEYEINFQCTKLNLACNQEGEET